MMDASRIVSIGAALGLIAVLRPYVRSRSAPLRERVLVMKAASAIRLMSGIALALLLMPELLKHSGAWPTPARWGVWIASLAVVFVWVGNALAGIWVLLPFLRADPGLTIAAAGCRGTIVGYGLSRLELLTRSGWSMHLPYLLLLYRPIVVRERNRPRRVELEFRRSNWSEEDLVALRQALILSPYRDVTSPVSVSRHADVVTVQLGLCHPGAERQVRQFLEHIIGGFVSAPLRTAAEKSTREQP